MRKRRKAVGIGAMLAGLGLASAEVIARRGWMIATGACTPAEYRRMIAEKISASQQTARSALSSRRPRMKSLLAPWYSATQRNVERLRRKSRRRH
jgi:hypothetical protein